MHPEPHGLRHQSYSYDNAGRGLARTDPRGGIATGMSYDDLDRPLSATYSDAPPQVIQSCDLGAGNLGLISVGQRRGRKQLRV